MQESVAHIILALGGILLLGIMTDVVGRRTALPRVTLLLIFGIVIGDDGLGLVPTSVTSQFELIADMALLMIGFLLGGKLTRKTMRRSGRDIIFLSLSAVVVTLLLVAGGLSLLGIPLGLAILLGCMATATDPAATVDVVQENHAKGEFAVSLQAIVALDDAWGVMIFSLCLAMVGTVVADGVTWEALGLGLRDMGGAVLLGFAIGLPAAVLTGRVREGEPMLTEALGLVFFCGGLALLLDVSFLLAAMTMGAVVANFAKHHSYPFHAIEEIEWPFMVVFFVLAGASLQVDSLATIGVVGGGYILLRTLGKVLGAAVGAKLAGTDGVTSRWMGLALLPQAGAAMGIALVASNYFEEYRQELLSVAISTTVLFEIVGPMLTSVALRHAGLAEPDDD